jgi:AcrR family transcriptional regulator
MGRIARFNDEQFVKATMKIAVAQGPAAVTIAAVAAEVGAPVGSVYHRYLSRDYLLASVWLQVAASFQKGFLLALENDAGLAAALYTPRWVRSHAGEACILLLYRREELVSGDWPEELKREALQILRELDDGVRRYAERTFGSAGHENLGRTFFTLLDVPYAAVLRYIRQGKKPPRAVEDYIRKTYFAIMGRKT